MKPLKLLLLATAVIFGRYSHSQKISKTSDIVLKDAYKDAFLMGVAVNPAITSGRDQASQDIVVKQFNSITVENVMKAALINPQPGVQLGPGR